jgi:hypothetical protein
MKFLIFIVCLFLQATVFCQNLQLHYDFRHTFGQAYNPANFPTLYFEYFKNQDSGKAFIKPGSFLFKMEADLTGDNTNIGKFFMQAAQTLRFWKPQIYLHLSYSGGMGLTDPKQYSYYITNTFLTGVQYTFKWQGAWLSTVLDYKYVPYQKPTSDAMYTLYWWKGYHHYKLEFAGDFSIWTENKNHGDEATENLIGKRSFFFAEPQIWYNISKTFSAGSKLNMYYHVNVYDNVFQAYPTLAVKYKL